MKAYTKGYRAGWISYLEKYHCPKNSLRILVIQADAVAEYASHGLLPQDDYWLGYHHGRTAAETCTTHYLQAAHH
ncbi:MAG: hypothetical protein AB7G75_03080 [Candidatus Binatia bacterium]